jgi:hypothetical protein
MEIPLIRSKRRWTLLANRNRGITEAVVTPSGTGGPKVVRDSKTLQPISIFPLPSDLRVRDKFTILAEQIGDLQHPNVQVLLYSYYSLFLPCCYCERGRVRRQ